MGNDGRMYKVMTTASGVHRWTHVPGGRCVTAVDNGGRPFRVHLSTRSGPGTAEVFVRSKDNDFYKYWKSPRSYISIQTSALADWVVITLLLQRRLEPEPEPEPPRRAGRAALARVDAAAPPAASPAADPPQVGMHDTV